jgi:hypothetical protein
VDVGREKRNVVIEQRHFNSALEASRPSLNRDEVERFKRIYREFAGGRSGGGVGKRQTMA